MEQFVARSAERWRSGEGDEKSEKSDDDVGARGVERPGQDRAVARGEITTLTRDRYELRCGQDQRQGEVKEWNQGCWGEANVAMRSATDAADVLREV